MDKKCPKLTKLKHNQNYFEMENLLDNIKPDFQRMLKLQKHITELETRLIYVSNINDKVNFNDDNVNLVNKKCTELYSDLNYLKSKWGL